MPDTKTRSNCPISSSLDIWGDKWSLLIVRDLMFFNRRTFGDFLNSEEKIATNILSSRLRTLEENGVITKSEHPESRAMVLYGLTNQGIDLLPIMVEIFLWSGKHLTVSAKSKEILKEIKQDKDAFIKRRTKELKKEYQVSA